jgi:magnesium chelatase subunit D
MAFDRDPAGFTARYADAETALAERLRTARALLDQVQLSEDHLLLIAEVCAAFEVDGMRADLVTARAAVAHAAWHGRTRVTKADIRAAARLALPHRRRRNPFDAPGLDEDLLDQLLGEDEPEPEPEPQPGADDEPEDRSDGDGPDGGREDEASGHDRSEPPQPADGPQPEPAPEPEPAEQAPTVAVVPTTLAAAGAAYRTRLFTATGVGAGEAGRRSRAVTRTGRSVGAAAHPEQGGRLHLPATIRAAAPRQTDRGRGDRQTLRLRREDLRTAVTEGRESNLVLLVVDASGSMAARRRMEAVKTAALSLLLDAYQRRDKVGLVTFRGATATLALPPTSSVEVAARRLDEVPNGGRTPLAEGLLCAAETLRLERIRDPRRRPLLVLVTDGRATSGPDAVGRSRRAADLLRASGVASVVVDCETGFGLGLARTLSRHLGAEHVPVHEVAADQLLSVVQRHRPLRPFDKLRAGQAQGAQFQGKAA